MNLGICKHVLISFTQRITLTVEITTLFLICDKFCPFLLKIWPFFMSFISFKVIFLYFHFNLTFLKFYLNSARVLSIFKTDFIQILNHSSRWTRAVLYITPLILLNSTQATIKSPPKKNCYIYNKVKIDTKNSQKPYSLSTKTPKNYKNSQT